MKKPLPKLRKRLTVKFRRLTAAISVSPQTAPQMGDIISISVGSDYLDCSVKYGNVKFLEDESTSDTLYFQGVSAGKDNIVISENGSDGVVFREYAVIVNDDLTVDLYPESNGIALLDGGYGINY